MILHTIVSLADIFPQEPPVSIVTRRTKYGFCEYTVTEGVRRISRRFSTDPADFLDIT
ncbi:MAG: hypothetical protein IJZ95_03310 [Oscillospiraceae bacterium]|nr:hypothetical protein [Oscillospiraceae bacterium]